MTLTTYAIIDAASEPELFGMLERYDPPASCLYAEPIQPELAELAPWIVQVDDNVREWLNKSSNYWGFYCESKANFKEVRQHWRKYLQVILPEREKPVFFRFYDPRNLWLVCETLSDWDLHCFMGPVDSITTVIQGEMKQDDFKIKRQQFPDKSFMRRKMLVINEQQFKLINQIFEQRYIEELAVSMKEWSTDYKTDDFTLFAKDLYDYLIQQGIDTRYQIEEIAKAFLQLRIDSVTKIPEEFVKLLVDDGTPGWFRANRIIHGNR